MIGKGSRLELRYVNCRTNIDSLLEKSVSVKR